jgi:hypothetical protein
MNRREFFRRIAGSLALSLFGSRIGDVVYRTGVVNYTKVGNTVIAHITMTMRAEDYVKLGILDDYEEGTITL